MIAIGITLTAIANKPTENVAAPTIVGSWKAVKTQYGKEPMKTRGEDDFTVIKTFTGTRWTGAFFNQKTREFDGAGGGTYKLKGERYEETIEYFSWDKEAVGQTVIFTLKMENGMLHQYGILEYKGDKNYVVDEWYTKID
jgi:hypothetical protein